MSSSSAHPGIVVGVDGSPQSDAAVEWAVRAAALRGVALVLVHALTDPSATAWLDVPLPEDYWESRRKTAEVLLDDATRIARGALPVTQSLTVDRALVTGSPRAVLVDMSEHADMVVVGCRGLRAIQRAVLGSVSAGLVHHARCPVAVVREAPSEDLREAPILVGIDGSPVSERAVAIAFDEASRRGVDLVALHTWLESTDDFIGVGWPDVREQADEILAERLAGWQQRYPDVSVHRVVAMDNPIRQLLELSGSAQLMVVGSHGRGGLVGLLLGSVSSAVVQSARIPVIVARSRP
ncbi:universal stress protein [Mycolicibacterium hippocampi]|uniref:Universal stress protein family n=1 Tax=Mycolicibacterium hippocampi TaxID=659824 RepID=A0A850PCY0_9MYCO|nr:universal stress protein [Mycolicibacterium hippocampi]NVN48341.1 Universal stress protein family [Mycolicibacterium hippocampi]